MPFKCWSKLCHPWQKRRRPSDVRGQTRGQPLLLPACPRAGPTEPAGSRGCGRRGYTHASGDERVERRTPTLAKAVRYTDWRLSRRGVSGGIRGFTAPSGPSSWTDSWTAGRLTVGPTYRPRSGRPSAAQNVITSWDGFTGGSRELVSSVIRRPASSLGRWAGRRATKPRSLRPKSQGGAASTTPPPRTATPPPAQPRVDSSTERGLGPGVALLVDLGQEAPQDPIGLLLIADRLS
jgi:hypothetical protein